MRNDFEIRGDETVIYLRRGDGSLAETLIETADLPLVSTITGSWRAKNTGRATYVATELSKGSRGACVRWIVYLHRFLTDAPEGLVVDHANHDTLDNRRSNLRVVTHTGNLLNPRGARSNNRSSGIHGVTLHDSGLWRATVQFKGKRIFQKYFHDKEEAGRAAARVRESLLAGEIQY